MSRRPRREFTEEFKLQMVKLYNSGKPTVEIVKEYDLTRSAFMGWVKKYNNTGGMMTILMKLFLNGKND